MKIIKLDATDSTNAYLKKMMQTEMPEDFTVIVAKRQTKGRGQIGTSWDSEAGKNLTFSVFKIVEDVSVKQQFAINICVSLAIFESLNAMNVSDLSVKWPNDILSGNQKICGVLIENTLSGHQIQASVIGVGLNVNQTAFENLPSASSLKSITGRTFDLDEVLHRVLLHLHKTFEHMGEDRINAMWAAYEKILFRKDKPSTFQNRDGDYFMGFIRGVSETGKLRVTLEDQVERTFDLKDIKLLY